MQKHQKWFLQSWVILFSLMEILCTCQQKRYKIVFQTKNHDYLWHFYMVYLNKPLRNFKINRKNAQKSINFAMNSYLMLPRIIFDAFRWQNWCFTLWSKHPKCSNWMSIFWWPKHSNMSEITLLERLFWHFWCFKINVNTYMYSFLTFSMLQSDVLYALLTQLNPRWWNFSK